MHFHNLYLLGNEKGINSHGIPRFNQDGIPDSVADHMTAIVDEAVPFMDISNLQSLLRSCQPFVQVMRAVVWKQLERLQYHQNQVNNLKDQLAEMEQILELAFNDGVVVNNGENGNELLLEEDNLSIFSDISNELN